jgi:hypothetical protein
MQEGAFSFPHAFSLQAASKNRAYKNRAAQRHRNGNDSCTNGALVGIRNSRKRFQKIRHLGQRPRTAQVPELTAVLDRHWRISCALNHVVRAGGSKRVPY